MGGRQCSPALSASDVALLLFSASVLMFLASLIDECQVASLTRTLLIEPGASTRASKVHGWIFLAHRRAIRQGRRAEEYWVGLSLLFMPVGWIVALFSNYSVTLSGEARATRSSRPASDAATARRQLDDRRCAACAVGHHTDTRRPTGCTVDPDARRAPSPVSTCAARRPARARPTCSRR